MEHCTGGPDTFVHGPMSSTIVESVPVGDVRPYGANPRDNSASVARVAASIREFGFLQPIVCDAGGVIVAGHTRFEAAKSLGLAEVPVVYARHLTPGQARAYRLADNKAGESSKWIDEILDLEMDALEGEFDFGELGFDVSGEGEARRAWRRSEKLCGTKRRIVLREKSGFTYASFFSTGREGRPIAEIKEDPASVAPFASNLADHVRRSLGAAVAGGDWCLATTPRRRHREGMHFASAVCALAAERLGIPFRADALTARNRHRIGPEFSLASEVPERNVVLYDDVLTTGSTLAAARELLVGAGHVVVPVVAIRN